MPRDRRDRTPDDRIRYEHMLEAAQQALRFIDGRSRGDLDTDDMLRRAVKDCVQEIGEAAARTSGDGREQAPDLPWPKMVGMRHILVHAYFQLDNDALWKVAHDEPPALVKSVQEALDRWPAAD